MTSNIDETLTNSINEALELPVIKDGELKLPIDELVIRDYDEHRRYGTDWVTEYNYVSEKSLTQEEFDKIVAESKNRPYGEISYQKRKLTYGNGKVYYRHILKAVMY